MTLFGQILVISSNDLQHRYILFHMFKFHFIYKWKGCKKISEFGSEIFEGVTFYVKGPFVAYLFWICDKQL